MSAAAWTFTATGLALGIIGIGVLFAAWWTEADRNDATDLQLADHEQQLGNLHILVAEHLGLEMDPDTDEIPAQPGIPTEPSDIPLQVQTALLQKPTPAPRATVERVIGDRTFTFREDQR